jgi:hypothetical protein
VGNTHEREIRNEGKKPQNSIRTAKLSLARCAKTAAGSAFETKSGEPLNSSQLFTTGP